MSNYYFLAGNDVRGPFSLADCFLLIDQGTLNATTMICQEGGEDWRALQAFPELSGARATQTRSLPERSHLPPAGVSMIRQKERSLNGIKAVGTLMIIGGLLYAMAANSGPGIVAMGIGFVLFVVGRFFD